MTGFLFGMGKIAYAQEKNPQPELGIFHQWTIEILSKKCLVRS